MLPLELGRIALSTQTDSPRKAVNVLNTSLSGPNLITAPYFW